MLLKNCKILDEEGNLISTNILIKNGKIHQINAKIKPEAQINENILNKKEKTIIIDCKDKIVFPGLIDSHVHFREPGLTHKEDFFTGSMAAAAGGITTVLDMPNTKPPTLTLKYLKEKRRLAEETCLVNFGFHFGSAINNIEEIKKATQLNNVASTKIFMNLSTGNMKIDDEKLLKDIFMSSKLISVHAEGEKVKLAIKLAKNSDRPVYLCHISTKEEIDYIKKEKTLLKINKISSNNGFNIFVEVTPHHLFLTKYDDKDSFTKMKPELTSSYDQKALLDAVNDGIVDTIGSDHAPHTIEEKLKFEFPYGVPGVETMLPLLLDAANKKLITLKKVQELCCENPARIFGITNKGKIKEGYDADLVIVDLNIEKVIKNEELFTKCKWSPFNGRKLKGCPVMTIVNGNVIFDDNRIPKIITEHKGKEVIYE
ncbi:amidohydrolase family protein [Candidatus Woesearchaeota archaeon]|nr:amidohydrolase family protein [Candidatus Woesearchaeota archaeon]